ncbi:HAD-IA family hydrolase [Aestuariibacter halophilus]|uniref:HAD-IA family hydrolase n=1 Tax=Fluctibacter halophilus TaxID=226011 RepID=A0ABS8G8S9_9ALTE|nr:HAD-IA family hydrolase [Aestuariibacter halophilus]MCC2615601.1 HAD-IA family hydrolase [Aestuariibacter halophilus]
MSQANKVEGVLFDLDGTLLDTADDLGAALNHVLAQHQRPLTEARQYRPVASDGALGLLKMGFGNALPQDTAPLRQALLDHYAANIARHTRLFDGMSQVLAHLDAQQIPWGIITNKPAFLTDALVPQFDELSTARVVLSGDSLAQRKPDPMPLLHAAEVMNIAPAATLYVGDAPRDIEATHRAGMISVAAAYGFLHDPTDAHQWGAHHVIDRADALLALLPSI